MLMIMMMMMMIFFIIIIIIISIIIIIMFIINIIITIISIIIMWVKPSGAWSPDVVMPEGISEPGQGAGDLKKHIYKRKHNNITIYVIFSQ